MTTTSRKLTLTSKSRSEEIQYRSKICITFVYKPILKDFIFCLFFVFVFVLFQINSIKQTYTLKRVNILTFAPVAAVHWWAQPVGWLHSVAFVESPPSNSTGCPYWCHCDCWKESTFPGTGRNPNMSSPTQGSPCCFIILAGRNLNCFSQWRLVVMLMSFIIYNLYCVLNIVFIIFTILFSV